MKFQVVLYSQSGQLRELRSVENKHQLNAALIDLMQFTPWCLEVGDVIKVLAIPDAVHPDHPASQDLADAAEM